jgi:hypothetical protein
MQYSTDAVSSRIQHHYSIPRSIDIAIAAVQITFFFLKVGPQTLCDMVLHLGRGIIHG